jgi:hypothetical protein
VETARAWRKNGLYHRLFDLAGAGSISGSATKRVVAKWAQVPSLGSSRNVTSTSALAEI